MLFGGINLLLSATSFSALIGMGFRIKAIANLPLSTFCFIAERGVVPASNIMLLSVFSSVILKIGARILSYKIAGSNLLTQSIFSSLGLTIKEYQFSEKYIEISSFKVGE